MQLEFDLSTMEQTNTIRLSRNRPIPEAWFEAFLMPEGGSYSPASFFSGRKYVAGMKAKIRKAA